MEKDREMRMLRVICDFGAKMFNHMYMMDGRLIEVLLLKSIQNELDNNNVQFFSRKCVQYSFLVDLNGN